MPASTFSLMRWATTSVSVWLEKTRPRAISSSRSGLKFSMMPLWTRATSLVAWGWALLVVGAPCVAQRVWAMPVVPGSGWAASSRPRLPPLDQAAMGGRNAGGIIAPVFEALEAVEQPVGDILAADDTNDSTHAGPAPMAASTQL
jgi:hypothetical protein